MREKSRPASVFSFSSAIFFGFTCIATAAATERAMSLAVGLSWKAYCILLWAILSPILSDAEQQVTTGVDAFWNSSITRMNTSLERKPIPTWILSTVSARVTTLSPTSPLPSSSYQMTRTFVGLAAHLDGGHPLERDLGARLHLRADVGADPGDGQERAEPDLVLRGGGEGSREERGQAEQERPDRRGLAHDHASAWGIVGGRTVAG